MIRTHPLLVALALLAGCSSPSDNGPIVVGVIGPTAVVTDPSRRSITAPSAVLLSQVAQGLVRFDAAGQIEPGLAIRWDVSDDGLYYTFRLGDGAIDAAQVARALRAAIAPTSRNPLQPVLGAIAEIVAVTPEVIEIRLTGPRPDLLPLFAQPQLAILVRGAGTGPFRIAERHAGAVRLSPIDPALGDETPQARARRDVWLRPEAAARAVARFAGGGSALVLGGRFCDLAIARAAAPPADVLRFDPAPGLLGFAVSTRGGFLAGADNRRALSMAIDRARIAGLFGTAWRPTARLLPDALVDRRGAATPDWIDAPLAMRRTLARETVATWLEVTGDPPLLRMALPQGPGSRMLFALIAADWQAIGVSVVRARAGETADLTLIDEVAPGDSAAWYLRRFECARSIACSEAADTALAGARTATTLPERAARLADADARLTEISAFIPLAQPVRWSLVSRRLPAWQDNRRAVHPLDRLRPD